MCLQAFETVCLFYSWQLQQESRNSHWKKKSSHETSVTSLSPALETLHSDCIILPNPGCRRQLFDLLWHWFVIVNYSRSYIRNWKGKKNLQDNGYFFLVKIQSHHRLSSFSLHLTNRVPREFPLWLHFWSLGKNQATSEPCHQSPCSAAA